MENNDYDKINKELANQYMKAVGLIIKLTHIIEHHHINCAADGLDEAKRFIKSNDEFYSFCINGFLAEAEAHKQINDLPSELDQYFI